MSSIKKWNRDISLFDFIYIHIHTELELCEQVLPNPTLMCNTSWEKSDRNASISYIKVGKKLLQTSSRPTSYCCVVDDGSMLNLAKFRVKSDAIWLWIECAYILDAAAHLSLNVASISLEINIRGHLSCASLNDRLCCEKSAESDFSTSLLYKTSLLAWYSMHITNIASWSWYFVIFSKHKALKRE